MFSKKFVEGTCFLTQCNPIGDSFPWKDYLCNVSSKNKKTLNLGRKIPYLGIFGVQFNYQIFNQYSRICKTIKFRPKKLRTKNASLRFGLECPKAIVIFVSRLSSLFNTKVLCKNLEFSNLQPKIPCLGILESNFEKLFFFSYQPHQICLIVKLGAEAKFLKFRTKNAYLK